ncbi:hypothetical protein TrLO_g3826 [Triparma laevis f. longispina]|uniref:Lipoyl-binding domain-containing protein n=1 Tax=Triparma laevis f. longispina TaxID=1714387 RepID=A0A9W7A313_9STRA|nr:hypothetical protein TrLO_g3826 [Triparma laevis f. longispina]
MLARSFLVRLSSRASSRASLLSPSTISSPPRCLSTTVHSIPLPSLGDIDLSGTSDPTRVLQWHVSPGDTVEVGDVLCDVEVVFKLDTETGSTLSEELNNIGTINDGKLDIQGIVIPLESPFSGVIKKLHVEAAVLDDVGTVNEEYGVKDWEYCKKVGVTVCEIEEIEETEH